MFRHCECRLSHGHRVSVRSTNSGASRQGTARLIRTDVFGVSVIEQWCDGRNVTYGFLWKRSARREVLFVPRWTRVIGCKEACRSETIVHLFEVRGARDDVVVSVKRVETETIANAKFDPGAGHELHQPHSTARRVSMLVPSTLNLHHSTDPARRDREAPGRLLDDFGEPIDRFRTRRSLSARARF